MFTTCSILKCFSRGNKLTNIDTKDIRCDSIPCTVGSSDSDSVVSVVVDSDGGVGGGGDRRGARY